jgi:hypothetical protein
MLLSRGATVFDFFQSSVSCPANPQSSSAISKKGGGGRRKSPPDSTQAGTTITADSQNSKTAIQASIMLVRVFVKLELTKEHLIVILFL